MTPREMIAADYWPATDQLAQHLIFDEHHRQQIIVDDTGECSGGCCQDKLIVGPSWDERRPRGHVQKIQVICRWTRLPCPTAHLSPLVRLYSRVNRNSRPLLFMFMGENHAQ